MSEGMVPWLYGRLWACNGLMCSPDLVVLCRATRLTAASSGLHVDLMAQPSWQAVMLGL